MKRLFALLMFVALLAGAAASVSAAPATQQTTAPDSAVTLEQLGPDWTLNSVEGPLGPYAVYLLDFRHTKLGTSVMVAVGQTVNDVEAQGVIETRKSELQSRDFEMSVAQGLGDGRALRGITRTAGIPELGVPPVVTVSYLARVGARFTEVLAIDATAQEDRLDEIGRGVANLQVERLRKLAQTSAPKPSPLPTSPPAWATPDARSLVLPPAGLGSGWTRVSATGDDIRVDVQYFNNLLDRSGFRIATITVTRLPEESIAEAAVGTARDMLAPKYSIEPYSGLGDGAAFRGTWTVGNGLYAVVYGYRVGPVALTVSGVGMNDEQMKSAIDADVLRVAMLQRDRVTEGGKTSLGAPESLTAPKPLPDPATLVLPVEQVGDGWALQEVQTTGSAESDADRSQSVTYVDPTGLTPERVGILVFVGRDVPSARMRLGLLEAGALNAGMVVEPVSNLGDDVAFRVLDPRTDTTSRVDYLFRVGPTASRVSVIDEFGLLDEVGARAQALSQQQVQWLLDTLPQLLAPIV